jgi:hypothetical protein
VLFTTKNKPPAKRIISFQLMPIGLPSFSFMKFRVKRGSVSLMIQVMVSKRIILKNIAISNPILLAFGCLFAGSLSDTIEIKMILSTPKTISRKVSVTRLTHIEGSVKSGIFIFEIIIKYFKFLHVWQLFSYLNILRIAGGKLEGGLYFLLEGTIAGKSGIGALAVSFGYYFLIKVLWFIF